MPSSFPRRRTAFLQLLLAASFSFVLLRRAAAQENGLGRVAEFETSLSTSNASEADASDATPQPGSDGGVPPWSQGHWWGDRSALDAVLREADWECAARLVKRRQGFKGPIPIADKIAQPGSDPLHFYSGLLVPMYPCPLEARLGAWGPQGKWVCLSHYSSPTPNQVPAVVSIGSDGDTSFEEDAYKRLGAVSHLFDFSLTDATTARLAALPYIRFTKAGVIGSQDIAKWREDYKDVPELRLLPVPPLLGLAGLVYADFLRIDCEKCEHGVIRDMRAMFKRRLPPFGQILMDLHHCGNATNTGSLLTLLEEMGYRLFHTEINPFETGKAEWACQLSFIHERLVIPRS